MSNTQNTHTTEGLPTPASDDDDELPDLLSTVTATDTNPAANGGHDDLNSTHLHKDWEIKWCVIRRATFVNKQIIMSTTYA